MLQKPGHALTVMSQRAPRPYLLHSIDSLELDMFFLDRGNYFFIYQYKFSEATMTTIIIIDLHIQGTSIIYIYIAF